jgi:putative ABC transport system ATP-binding protein
VPDTFLTVEKVRVGYGEEGARATALQDVSLSFLKGSLTLVMGPSGSGKTTLLSLLGCLLIPDSGSVYVCGREITRLNEKARTLLRRQHIGFIFQAFRLFHSLSALDNVTLASDIYDRCDRRAMATKLLAGFGLQDRMHVKPKALSGGEKQRVAIARALIKNPSILLADEPTASLDSEAGARIAGILFDLARNEGRTVVVVSHDPRWERSADRVVILRDGEVMEDRSGES